MRIDMKVLLTGGHGFIGTHLFNKLVALEHEVYRVPKEVVREPIALSSLFRKFKPELVFHLSAYGNMASQIDSTEMFVANYWDLYNLINYLKDIPYKAFINVSSSSVMLNHQTMYSATKMGGEYLCKAFHDEYNKPIATIRPYSVYGPGEADFRFIPTVFRSCLSGEPFTLVPNAVHDWVYVSDVVDQMLECAEHIKDCQGTSLNVGTGYATRNSEVVKMIEKITGKKANYKISDKPLRSYDNENWVNKMINPTFIKLEEGLTKYYESIK